MVQILKISYIFLRIKVKHTSKKTLLKDFWDIRLRTYNFEGTFFIVLLNRWLFKKIFLEIYQF